MTTEKLIGKMVTYGSKAAMNGIKLIGLVCFRLTNLSLKACTIPYFACILIIYWLELDRTVGVICFHLCNFDWLSSVSMAFKCLMGLHEQRNLARERKKIPFVQFHNELIYFLHDKLWLVIMNSVSGYTVTEQRTAPATWTRLHHLATKSHTNIASEKL